MFNKPMHRQVLLLASAQALFQIVSVIVITVGGLAGARLASAPHWATLPIAAMFLGSALVTFPAAMWMAKAGRRVGFICGSSLGLAGGCIGALGIAQQSMALLATGTFLVGAYQSFAQFYRFAASEVADEAFRPRAISLVMAGGIVAALVGPALARLGGPIFAAEYKGSFIILAVVTLVAACVLTGLKMPPAPMAELGAQPGRRWQEIVLQPAYLYTF